MKVLLVEDDTAIQIAVGQSLREGGYQVDMISDGLHADTLLHTETYDAVILDLNLPRLDGLEVLRQLRRRGQTTPVLVLSARDALQQRVAGLDAGADDYLTKPFDLSELEARLRALLRRGLSPSLQLGQLRWDWASRCAYVRDTPLELSSREIAVLELLLQRAGKVVPKEHLVASLSDLESDIGANAIEVYIHRLRRKLELSGVEIRTIRGLGYLLEPLDVHN